MDYDEITRIKRISHLNGFKDAMYIVSLILLILIVPGTWLLALYMDETSTRKIECLPLIEDVEKGDKV